MRRLVLLVVFIISGWSMTNAQEDIIFSFDFDEYTVGEKPSLSEKQAEYGLDKYRVLAATFITTDTVGTSNSLHLTYRPDKDGSKPLYNFVAAASILDTCKGKNVHLEAYVRLIDSVEPINLVLEQLVTFDSGDKVRLQTPVAESDELIKYTTDTFYYDPDFVLDNISYSIKALTAVDTANNNLGFQYFIDSVKVIAVDEAPVVEEVQEQTVYLDSTETIVFNFSDEDNLSEDLTIELVGFSNIESFATFNGSDSLVIAPIAGNEGEYNLVFKVTDPAGLSDSTVFKVKIIDWRSPVVEDYSNVAILSDESRDLVFNITDNDTDIGSLITTLEGDDISAFGQLNGTTLTLNTEEANVGVYSVIYKVSDGTYYDTTEFTITVLSRIPVIVDHSDEDVYIGKSNDITFSVSDNDTPIEDLVLTMEGDDISSFSELTGTTLTLTPGESDAGKYDVICRVTDPDGNTDTTEFVITVLSKPVIEDHADEIIYARESTDITFTVSDDDNPVEDLVLTMEGDDISSFSELTGTTLTLTPNESDNGEYDVICRVTDPDGNYDTTEFTITILSRIPVIVDNSNEVVYTGESTEIIFSVSDNDTPVEDLVLTMEGDDISSFSELTGTTLTLTPGESDNGEYDVICRVTDPDGNTDTTAFVITVLSKPVIEDHADEIIYSGETTDIIFNVTDNDTPADDLVLTMEGDDISSFSQMSGTTLILTPAESEVGIYDVVCRVTDTEDNYDTTAFTITVLSRIPVIVDNSNEVVYTGESTEIIFSVSDNDTPVEDLVLTMEGDDISSFSELTGTTLTLTPGESDNGEYDVICRVTDLEGNTDTTAFVITILSKPVIEDHADEVIYTGKSTDITFIVSDNDTPVEGLVLTMEGDDISSFSELTGTTLTLTPAEANTGEYNVICKVTDSDGNTDTTAFVITVLSSIPTIEGLTDTTLEVGSEVKLPFVITDNDTPIENITVTVEGPDFVTINADTLVISPALSDTAGVYMVTVKATDVDGNSSEVTINIEVTGKEEEPLGFVNSEVMELIVAPNPTNGQFTVNSSKVITGYTVYSIIGEVVIQNTFVKGNSVNINMSGNDNGTYIVKVDFENETSEVVKVIVK